MADRASYFVPFDLDSGGGNEFIVGFSPRGSASGGSAPIFSAVAALVDNLANPTVGGVQTFPMLWDGATWDRMPGNSADGLIVDLGANNTVDTELPAAAMLTDAIATPTAPAVGSFLMGYDRVNTNHTRIDGLVDGQVDDAATAGFLMFGSDGTNYLQVLTSATGAVQVDVLSGGGSPPAPATPINDTFTSVSVDVGDGNKVNIDTAELTTIRKLAWIDVWCSTNWKGEVFTIDDGTPSTRKGITGGEAMRAVQYVPVHEDFIQTAANAGLDAFRLTFTNLDENLTADAHVVFHYND